MQFWLFREELETIAKEAIENDKSLIQQEQETKNEQEKTTEKELISLTNCQAASDSTSTPDVIETLTPTIVDESINIIAPIQRRLTTVKEKVGKRIALVKLTRNFKRRNLMTPGAKKSQDHDQTVSEREVTMLREKSPIRPMVKTRVRKNFSRTKIKEILAYSKLVVPVNNLQNRP